MRNEAKETTQRMLELVAETGDDETGGDLAGDLSGELASRRVDHGSLRSGADAISSVGRRCRAVCVRRKQRLVRGTMQKS